MASASSLAHFNSGDSGDRGLETVEIDPQFAEGLGFALGDVVRTFPNCSSLLIYMRVSCRWKLASCMTSVTPSLSRPNLSPRTTGRY